MDAPEFADAERESARTRARAYFDLALRYARPLDRPTVVAVAGLSGTGKTTLARATAGELGWRVVSADAVRKSLFGVTAGAGYGEGPYGAGANTRTYRLMLEKARALLQIDGGVVLDATFRREADREEARLWASEAGADWCLVECRLPPERVRARLERRAASGEGLSDATWETYLRQRGEFEPVRGTPRESHLVLETGGEIGALARAATDWLRACRGEQICTER